MEHVDNSMDDLFRKAGDLYPLKTSDSDWDAVSDNLRKQSLGEQSDLSLSNATQKGNKRRWGLLLLLIPIGLGSLIYISSNRKKEAAISTSAVQKVIQSNEVKRPSASSETDNTNNASDSKQARQNILSSPDKNLRASPDRNFSKKNAAVNKSRSVTNYPASTNSARESVSTSNSQGKVVESTPVPGSTLTPAAVVAASSAPMPKPSAATQDGPTAQSVSKDSLNQKSSSVKKEDQKSKSQKGFYVGLLAGPDWSTVKMQSVNQTGFSIGALLGYRFNKRLSIETGLMWDKKYYYSKSDYFKTDHPVPPAWKTWTVDGTCNMFEIPLALRFDFATGKTHNYFVKAGLASYIMKKQQYSYGYELSNGYHYDTAYHPIENTLNYFFSIVQLSAGYEHSIGGNTNIRIEPYIKIPLQGFGLGNMPIASTGIYFGIIHTFK
jgi:hypothetical protein